MSPDSLHTWAQLLLALPALVGAYNVPKAFRWLKMRLTQAFAGAMLAQIMPVLDELRTQIADVRHQVYPNSGGSLDDKMTRTLHSTERTERQVGVLHSTMRAHQDADLSQARFEADAGGRFTWASHALLRWCNRALDQIAGHGWVNCVAQADRDRVRHEWEAAVLEQREFILQFRMRAVDGEEFQVDAFAKPIRFGNPAQVEQWVGVVTRVAHAG